MSYAEYGPAALTGARFDRWIMFGNHTSPLFNVMNAKYFLAPPGAQATDPGRFRAVFRGDMTIFENLDAMPRAWVVSEAVVPRDPEGALTLMASPAFDPRLRVVLEDHPDPAFLADMRRVPVPPSATIRSIHPDLVEVDATLPVRGWLVLADTYFPGWEATVDGQGAKILRANYNFRALPLRAGSHRVVFSYHPRAAARGRLLTALGCLLGFGGLGLAAVRERRETAARQGGAGTE